MILKLLTEHHLEFLRLKGGCRDSSESTLVKKSKTVGNLITRLILHSVHGERYQGVEYIGTKSPTHVTIIRLFCLSKTATNNHFAFIFEKMLNRQVGP